MIIDLAAMIAIAGTQFYIVNLNIDSTKVV